MASYRELRVREKAIELGTEIYQLCKYLPKEETYGLSGQMKRAAVSIPSNIAEGQARNSEKNSIRFLYNAQGSRAELETQQEICVQLHYLSKDQIASAEPFSAQTGRMIRTIICSLQHQSLPTTNHQPPTSD